MKHMKDVSGKSSFLYDTRLDAISSRVGRDEVRKREGIDQEKRGEGELPAQLLTLSSLLPFFTDARFLRTHVVS